jgi:hypothetical protein
VHISIGDMVLVNEVDLVSILPGKDVITRVFTFKISIDCTKRPTNKLCVFLYEKYERINFIEQLKKRVNVSSYRDVLEDALDRSRWRPTFNTDKSLTLK